MNDLTMTLFHRTTDAAYAPPCDVASLPVLDAADQPAGFVGAAWGEWSNPQDCLNWAFCLPEEVDTVLATWGLHRVPFVFAGGSV